jgi:hypothetical protein
MFSPRKLKPVFSFVITEKQYESFINYAKSILKKKGQYVSDPCDVVNDAYLKLETKGEECTFENMRRFIYNVIMKLRDEPKFVSLQTNIKVNTDPNYNMPNKNGYKICPKCKRELSLDNFQFYFRHHKYEINTYCNTCQNKSNKMSNSYIRGLLVRCNKYSYDFLHTHPWVVKRKKNELIYKRSLK